MNTKTITIISICALALLSTISGITYSVFCDTETNYGTMIVSTQYYNPIPGPIVFDANVSMVKCSSKHDTNPYGIFEYNSSNYRLFYNFEGDIQDDGFDHIWMLIVWENETNFYLIDSNKTDGLQTPDKHVVMNGSIDLNADLVNATMFVISNHYWNATYMDIKKPHLGQCLHSIEMVNYYDTYKFEP